MSTMPDTKPRRTRRSFTDDFKAGAIRLVLDEGQTVAAAARDLGLTSRHFATGSSRPARIAPRGSRG